MPKSHSGGLQTVRTATPPNAGAAASASAEYCLCWSHAENRLLVLRQSEVLSMNAERFAADEAPLATIEAGLTFERANARARSHHDLIVRRERARMWESS
jgi:hypothetical protein